MIKVLFVYTHTVLGGGETMLMRTISSFNREDVLPIAIISQKNERLFTQLSSVGIETYFINDENRPLKNKFLKALIQIPNFLVLNLKLFFIILKTKPDIVHSGLFYSALWSILPSKLSGKKFVWVGQTLSDFFSYPLISKFLLFFSDATILTCADFERLLAERKMLEFGKTQVIYTSVDIPNTRENNLHPNINGLSINRPIVSIIARFDESQKGFIYFWKMAKIIHQEMPEVSFVVAGAPVNEIEQEFKSRLDKLAIEFGIRDSVSYVGFVSDLPHFFSCVDVVVIPSVYEAPSAVAMEAGASGRPVVAFSVGGIPEVIKNEENGYLVLFENFDGLAQKTMWLLKHPEVANSMGEKGRVFVEKMFSKEKLAENYMRLYKSLLSKT